MNKTIRLNRKGNSNYALFIIDETSGTVDFRMFKFYTGPMTEDKTMTINEGRNLYKEMINQKRLIDRSIPSRGTTNEWILVKE